MEYYSKNYERSPDKIGNQNPQWITIVKLKMKEKIFSNFEILIKKAIITKSILILNTFFLFLSYSSILSIGTARDIFLRIVISLLSFIFIGLFLFFSLLLIWNLKDIFTQNKYNISNHNFRKKYVIITHSDPQKIRDIFSEKVCNKIVNYTPEIINIEIKENCLSDNFGYNKQLSLDLCEKYLNKLINKAKLFERD